MTFNFKNSVIFSLLGLIILLGSLTIYSVTSIDINSFLRFLLINIFVIIIVVLLFNQINLNRIFSFGWLLFLLNILLVLSVEVFGKEINGSKRWLDFGFLSLQPSEFMKITYALFVTQYLRFYSLISVTLCCLKFMNKYPYLNEREDNYEKISVNFIFCIIFEFCICRFMPDDGEKP